MNAALTITMEPESTEDPLGFKEFSRIAFLLVVASVPVAAPEAPSEPGAIGPE